MVSRIILAAVLAVFSAAHGPKQPPQPPQPPDNIDAKPLTQSEVDKIYCRPEVIAAMDTVWQMTGDGTQEYEAAFIVSRLGNVFIEPMEPGRRHAQTVYIWGNTVALFHVHPNSCACEWPSTPDDNYEHNGEGDTGLADKYKIDMYVITDIALTRYRPGVGNEKLAVGGDWMKPGKECTAPAK